jgi:BirA family biotin operon repressor/biotin-[acetyl-CoA-carboxylase] ligase
MTLDARILKALRDNGEGMSGAELAHKLQVTRATIWARIEDLRSAGYDIEASPHLGYRLLSAPDLLHADDLYSRLARTKVVGRDIRVFEETSSSNDVVARLARDGLKEGLVVFAESQTKARGRLGRRWLAPARKGLWFSLLLRPELRPHEATRLTIASATAVRRAIAAQTGLRAEIKWPNDILVGGKKAAGILTELYAELERVQYVILGIGIDVNLNATDFPADLRSLATSLKIELGKTVSRPELAVRVLQELDYDYYRICSGRFGEVAEEWQEQCTTIGHNVVIRTGKREIRGRAESLGDDGAFLLRTEHGHLERITGGDVTLEK